jgi:hypothetical protein
MLHCNGNKLAGPSFPNKSLPIAISMIAANNRKPFPISGSGFLPAKLPKLSREQRR